MHDFDIFLKIKNQKIILKRNPWRSGNNLLATFPWREIWLNDHQEFYEFKISFYLYFMKFNFSFLKNSIFLLYQMILIVTRWRWSKNWRTSSNHAQNNCLNNFSPYTYSRLNLKPINCVKGTRRDEENCYKQLLAWIKPRIFSKNVSMIRLMSSPASRMPTISSRFLSFAGKLIFKF